MPKGALKTATKRKQTDKSGEDVDINMKEMDSQTTSVSPELGEGGSTSAKHDAAAQDMSANSSAQTKKGKKGESSLPDKPRRVFVLAGTILKKKQPEVPKESGNIDKSPERESATDETVSPPRKVDEEQTNKGNEGSQSRHDGSEMDTNKDEDEQPFMPAQDEAAAAKPTYPRRSFGDDDHPYEDPSLVVNVNNSATLQQHKQQHAKPAMEVKPLQQQISQTSMKQPRRTPSPVELKSTDDAAVTKPAKGHHSSVMEEHSIPRSIFALLVSLLLSLIVFLALHFLLHCHPVLSVVVATLVFVLIFMVLGFLNLSRMKCLILLFLSSVGSKGAKLALYVLVLYFVFKGPLCNTIGNIKRVRHSVLCVNSEQSRYTLSQALGAAQKCVDTTNIQNTSTRNNDTQALLNCLLNTCLATKQQLEIECVSQPPKISQKICNMTDSSLSCADLNNSKIPGTEGCRLPKGIKMPCQKEFDKILEILGRETDDDHCDFFYTIGMVLPLLILLLFCDAYSYEKNYRTYNGFHNYFLTGHFQCIDQSRSSCDRAAVLPLRKVELRQHVPPSTLRQMTDGEKQLVCTDLKKYFILLLFVLLLILADLFVFRTLDTGNVQSDRPQSPTPRPVYEHDASILIDLSKTSNNRTNTTTPAGNLTAATNNKTRDNQIISNGPVQQMVHKDGDLCLVRVVPPGVISIIILPTLLVLLLLISILQVYVIRLQWYICSKFYKGREKERVFYLYNKILEDRIQLVENCRKRMKCYHREMNTLNSLEPTRILANQSKWFSKMLKFFHINLRRCVICNDPEKAAFKLCHGADCSGVYCLTCSFDIDKKCLYCDTKLKRNVSKKLPVDKNLSSKESLV